MSYQSYILQKDLYREYLYLAQQAVEQMPGPIDATWGGIDLCRSACRNDEISNALGQVWNEHLGKLLYSTRDRAAQANDAAVAIYRTISDADAAARAYTEARHGDTIGLEDYPAFSNAVDNATREAEAADDWSHDRGSVPDGWKMD